MYKYWTEFHTPFLSRSFGSSGKRWINIFDQMRHSLVWIVFFLLWSCTEEVVVTKEIEVKKSWTEKPEFTGRTKIKIHSFSTEKSLFVYGPGFFSVVTDKNEVVHYP